MAILVGQLIEILQKYDRDREVTIHTLKGETVEVNDLLAMAAPWMLIGMIVGLVALFTCPVLMAECFCLALTIDRYYEIKDEKNGNR